MPSYDLTPCPVCASNDAEQIASADDARAEVEMLWAFHQRRLRPATPPRALADRVTFSQDPPLRLAQCRRCSLIYRNPRERAVELVETYAAEMPDDATLRTLHENQRRAYRAQVRRLERAHGRRGAGLEVGSYVGAFLAAARDAGWTFEGLDVNERAAAFARRMGFRVTVGELDDITGRRFDAVAIWNCFEQLPDPRAAAVSARRLLNEGACSLSACQTVRPLRPFAARSGVRSLRLRAPFWHTTTCSPFPIATDLRRPRSRVC